jgi:hypothetical protein
MSTTQLAAPAVSKVRSEDVRTRPLASAIGAEILGVDLSKPMDDAFFARIRDIWHESHQARPMGRGLRSASSICRYASFSINSARTARWAASSNRLSISWGSFVRS